MRLAAETTAVAGPPRCVEPAHSARSCIGGMLRGRQACLDWPWGGGPHPHASSSKPAEGCVHGRSPLLTCLPELLRHEHGRQGACSGCKHGKWRLWIAGGGFGRRGRLNPPACAGMLRRLRDRRAPLEIIEVCWRRCERSGKSARNVALGYRLVPRHKWHDQKESCMFANMRADLEGTARRKGLKTGNDAREHVMVGG